MRYATALAEWGDAGGYDAEVFWDACCTKAIGEPFADLERRPLRTFSGGEQKRLALEALLRSDYDVLLLDEPDNFLDVPGKRWLEGELQRQPQDDPVRQPRPRAAGRHGHEDRHDRRPAARGRTAAGSPATTRPARRTSRTASTRWRCTRTSASGSRSSSIEMRRRAKISDKLRRRG